MKARYFLSLILILLSLLLLPKISYLGSTRSNTDVTLQQVSTLGILGPNSDPNPVVNEGRQIQLSVTNSAGQIQTGFTFESGSPDIAQVDPQTGIVSGRQRGFVTITARRGSDTISNFVVVARVVSGKGAKVMGETKTDTSGAVYFSDPIRNIIFKRDSPTSDARLFAGQSGMRGLQDGVRNQSQFAGPIGVAVDNRPQGGIYIADTLNHSIRKIGFDDRVTKVLGIGSPGTNSDDTISFDRVVLKSPQGVAVDSGGRLFIADTDNHAIYMADFEKQQLFLLAGEPGVSGNQNGKGRAAKFKNPTGIVVQQRTGGFGIGSSGGIVVADSGNGVVKFITFDGQVSTLGRMQRSTNNLSTEQTTDEFRFNEPRSVSIDGAGNIYVVDKDGAKVITQPITGQRQLVSLAQPIVSFNQAMSVVVRGTETIILDANSTSDQDAIKVVSIGAPEINNLSRTSDKLEGGADLVITGKNFAPESQVVIGDKVVTDARIESATRITLRIPAQIAPGDRTVSIQTRGGVAQTLINFRSKSLSEINDGQITTVTGGVPFLGDSGNARLAQLKFPQGVAIDSTGNIIISDTANNRIRRVDTSGVITTIAGTGTRISSGDAGSAISAALNSPRAVVLDIAGNILVAEFLGHRVRKIDVNTGIITTIAGVGIPGFDGEGRQAIESRISFPYSLAVDSENNIFVAVLGNNRVRKIDAKTGLINTVAGSGLFSFGGDGGAATEAALRLSTTLTGRAGGGGIALDKDGNLHIADTGNNRIRRVDARTGVITTVVGTGTLGFSGDNGSAINARLNQPYNVFFDINNNMIIVDSANNVVRRVDSRGIITTVAGIGGRDGFSGDGAAATSATLNFPIGTAIDGNGNIIISDQRNDSIRKVDANSGLIDTIVGSGPTKEVGDKNAAVAAFLRFPSDLAFDATGNLFIADTDNRRIRLVRASDGTIDTVAVNADGFTDPTSLAVDSRGNLFVTDYINNRILRVDIQTGNATVVAGNGSPSEGFLNLDIFSGIAVDNSGGLYISDQINHRIRRVDLQTGGIRTIAGTGPSGEGNGAFAGDGGIATNARLNRPLGIALDSFGNIFFADSGNFRVRRIDARTGIITTVAGNGSRCCTGNNGPAIRATVDPVDVTVDADGNLFIADFSRAGIRRVDARLGIITTVAGTGEFRFAGDNGAAEAASFELVASVVIDPVGNLLVADANANVVRAVKRVARGNGVTQDFSFSITPQTQTVRAGETADYNIQLMLSQPFSGVVSFNFSNLPPGATIPRFQGNTEIPFKVVTAPTTPAGSYPFTLIGTSGALTRTATATLVVQEPTAPTITAAAYNKPNLTISGNGFGVVNNQVLVNGSDVSSAINSQASTQLVIKGNKKKLNIKRGTNQVVVVSNGLASSPFTFNF